MNSSYEVRNNIDNDDKYAKFAKAKREQQEQVEQFFNELMTKGFTILFIGVSLWWFVTHHLYHAPAKAEYDAMNMAQQQDVVVEPQLQMDNTDMGSESIIMEPGESAASETF